VRNNGKDATFEEAKQKNQTTKKLRDKIVITIVLFRGTVPVTGHQMAFHEIMPIRCRGGKYV